MLFENNKLKKEILLILFGAILASIPTLISTYMQNSSEKDQLILTKKIEALEKFSKSYNIIVTDLLPQLEKFEERMLFISEEYSNDEKVDENLFKSTRNDFLNLLNDYQSWIADVNTNILIINAIYELEIPLFEIAYFDPLKSDLSHIDVQKILAELRDDAVNLKKRTVKQINDMYKIMDSLSHMI